MSFETGETFVCYANAASYRRLGDICRDDELFNVSSLGTSLVELTI